MRQVRAGADIDPDTGNYTAVIPEDSNGHEWNRMTNNPYHYDYQPVPPRPPKKKRPGWQVVLFLLVGGFALVIVAGLVFGDSDDDSDQASATTTRRPAPIVTSPIAPTTVALPPTPANPNGAQTATEAGCEEPDPSVVTAISDSLIDGRTVTDLAAVKRTVDGIEYEYVSGNVHLASGERDRSGVVWISPGVGVMGFSSSAEDVSTLPDGGVIEDAEVFAGDDYFSRVIDCTTALSRGN